jgi:DNA mismatch repair protein MutS
MQKMNYQEFKQKYNYATATPMMQQYLDAKFAHYDCLLLFRMGDFYELFFEDAEIGAELLNIALTKRSNEKEAAPMAGIPHHSLESYLNQLIEAGYKVAICEQQETPEQAKKRAGHKAVVKREVTRVLTAGTVNEESLLQKKAPSYLMALVKDKNYQAIAYVDISTNEFYTCQASKDNLENEISRISPKEILLSDNFRTSEEISGPLAEFKRQLVYQEDSFFDVPKNRRRIESFYGIHTADALGYLSASQIAAIGGVIEYLLITHKTNLPRLNFPKTITPENYLEINSATRKNLELTKTMSGSSKGSLLSEIDKTVTSGGGRMLYNWLSFPLTDKKLIDNRLETVEYFLKHIEFCWSLREKLKSGGDLERSLTRITTSKAFPRDLVCVKEAMKVASGIKASFFSSQEAQLPELLAKILGGINADKSFLEKLDAALLEEPAAITSGGGIIRPQFEPELERLYQLIENSTDSINSLCEKYRKETGVNTLRIKQNNILGLFVEVSPANSDKLSSQEFIHRQTLSNAVRYTTEELRRLESDIGSARSRAISLEGEIFANLCSEITRHQREFQKLASSLNALDILTSFAYLADDMELSRPEITEDNRLEITGGRHIVVEKSLKKQGEEFIGNDCNMNNDLSLWLITGPNMSGKSTFLRQNALIVILAQMGCFVPAKSATIGIVDKLFCRLGASDDLARGESTFMVEMVEAASILAQAGPRSLIILDEVGRGTATFDGVSIAWSCAEYIHNVATSRCLFATHYHELTQLENNLSRLKNFTIKTIEDNDKVIFTHKICEGPADKSYGIFVGELAGLPKSVVERAKHILKFLESSEERQTGIEELKNSVSLDADMAEKLDSLQAAGQQDTSEGLKELKSQLEKIDINNLTPIDAFNKLKELQDKVRNSETSS